MTSVPSFSSRVGLIRRSRARHAASRGGWARASQSRLMARPPRVPSAGASRCGCSKPARRRRPTSPRETARSRSPCGVPGCRTRAAPASGAGIPWPIPGAARAAGRSQPKGAQPARDGEEAWRLRCWFILKINTALARELRKLDPALVSAELREAPSC